jgi:hypothetical protein
MRDRKITRKETVHLDPETGIATSEVTVNGEDLYNPNSGNMESSCAGVGSGSGWFLCCPGSGQDRHQNKDQKEESKTSGEDQRSLLLCDGFNHLCCMYDDTLKEFFHWNNDLYSTWNGYMTTGCKG